MGGGLIPLLVAAYKATTNKSDNIIMALDNHQLMKAHYNQSTLDGPSRVELGEETHPGGSTGGVLFHCFGSNKRQHNQ